MVNEKLLHYIWQYQLFNKTDLRTVEGEHLFIQNPGVLNQHQGPDFLNAKMKIEQTSWTGSVEIHIKSTDWNVHQHSDDCNYSNVILHVVWIHDRNIHLPFPTLEICQLVPKILIEKYYQLMVAKVFIPCENMLNTVVMIEFEKCKERMLIERLEVKSQQVLINLKLYKNNWEACCWSEVFRTYGGKVNGDAFVQIFKVLFLKNILMKQFDAAKAEALMMGLGGLLKNNDGDDYYLFIKGEYEYLQKKYKFSIPKIQLYFLRMRPSSFPTIKLSQLAKFLCARKPLFRSILFYNNISEVRDFFKISASSYWDRHYVFNDETNLNPKILGKEMLENILINVVVPLLYTYGRYNGLDHLKIRAIDFLGQLQKESNSIIRKFQKVGMPIFSAQDSQSLIHLKKEYCDLRKCLECSIGYSILKK